MTGVESYFSLFSGTVKKYQVQRGRRIESIVGVNTTGKELMFMVRYRGAEPHHQRSEFVPSSVLRQHALEVRFYRDDRSVYPMT